MNSTETTRKKESFVPLCVVFSIVTIVLFAAIAVSVFVPKTFNALDDTQEKTLRAEAAYFAGVLNTYIYDSELALRDIANRSSIAAAFLTEEGIGEVLRENARNMVLPGGNPELSLVDIDGRVIYSKSIRDENVKWITAIVDKKKPSLVDIIEVQHDPMIRIAIPVLSDHRLVGVLVAHIDASVEHIFIDENDIGGAVTVSYAKNGKTIFSEHRDIGQSTSLSLSLPQYGLAFTYNHSQYPLQEKKNQLLYDYILGAVVGSLLLIVLFWLIGRRMIGKPFQALASAQDAIELSLEGIAQIDARGNYVNVNRSYATMLGYTPEDLKTKHWFLAIHEEDIPLIESASQEMQEKGKACVEVRSVHANNSIVFRAMTLIKQNDDHGRFMGHHCFSKNVTDEKLKEQEGKRQEEELRLIFDSVPVRIWYKNDKNCILRLNKVAAESMGGNVEDFEGKNAYDLFPNMAKKYHEDDLAVIQSQTPKLNIIEEYTPLNGPESWVSTDKIPYKDPESQENYVFVCAQDITSLKSAEMEKNQLVKRLSDSNVELEQFAYIASHDLKSPLRGIEQLVGWIGEDCAELLPEKSKKHLNLMASRVQRMTSLLDDLLLYSRVDRFDLSLEEVGVKSVVNQLLDLHVQPFGFTFELAVPEVLVCIPRKPFEMIIRNLLDNAVKHHHNKPGHIEIQYHKNDTQHVIEIHDDGPGIDPAMHQKVFAMFQTLQSRDKVEGSGMGLAIIKKILNRYDGEINIDSDGVNGTTFNVIWPCTSEQKDQPQATE